MDCKVALVCCAKHEEKYIKDFIEYYIDLGIDKIFIADNNESDYTYNLEELLSGLPYSDKIIIEDYNDKLRFQIKFYNTIYKRESSNYDWFLFLDIDEYLTGIPNINNFLNNDVFKDFNCIVFPWQLYDDNDELMYREEKIINRFPRVCKNYQKEVKCAYRSNLDISISLHYGHGDCLKECNPYGLENPLFDVVKKNKAYRFYSYNVENIFIKHFRFKTIGEYILYKIDKGRPCVDQEDYWISQCSNKKILNTFFKYNKFTHEKMAYGIKLLEEIRNKRIKT